MSLYESLKRSMAESSVGRIDGTDGVTDFLKGVSTKVGGKTERVTFDQQTTDWLVWSVTPEKRQALASRDDEDRWDDEYSSPLQKEYKDALLGRLGIGRGYFSLTVEKDGRLQIVLSGKNAEELGL